jgi:outer membrane lipoprotein-sorting protein
MSCRTAYFHTGDFACQTWSNGAVTAIAAAASGGFRFVEKVQRKHGTDTSTQDFWVDPATKLPLGIEVTFQSTDPMVGQMTSVLSDFILDAPLEQSLFSADPPEGYTKMK